MARKTPCAAVLLPVALLLLLIAVSAAANVRGGGPLPAGGSVKEALGSPRMPIINERALYYHVVQAIRGVPKVHAETVAKAVLRALASFPVKGGTVGDFYNILLSNANNTPRSTADFKGLVFSYRYPNFPKTDVFLFRSGRFTTAARGWNTWAFRGCYPNWDGSNTVWFQPPERC
ncbi:hypothetical protein I4F81_012616 [Pyropia yezoensis]|uniref:Uncharacterized protein n=1 Tax=Pyropia yezoensis TaxID=2788 RepID=A0ACC3CIP2_PYRYE|nr:hypothetical protein I4F81_012616 [Neopyropia yezoensis]